MTSKYFVTTQAELQRAINDAESGDEVVLLPGDHGSGIVLPKKQPFVIVRSATQDELARLARARSEESDNG